MSGIGSGHNKFHTCKGCPDRTVEPNCHNTCQGYIYRQEQFEKRREKAKSEADIKNYKYNLGRGQNR